ncbi:MAG: helix-turn-helix domain-containing protein [Corallococcus sp.]|nr:helix-turn-helix domain-containing protein [Corallococcus sp.]MCM1359965.1 helix-turn-helix domain-containing protein [Corallococcus sp.]MCM1395521.1 helix-turn-helix domain-containing protein [Corallococcus sp.]
MVILLGQRLSELRQEMDLTQVELANAIGVSKGCISLWENGLREPTLTSLIALAQYFDITLDELVGLKNDF